MTQFIIAKLGACSALGTRASGIQAELAAETSAFEHILGPRGAVTVAALETLPPGLDQHARRRKLLGHALDDLFDNLSCSAIQAIIILASESDENVEALGEALTQRLRTTGIEARPPQVESHGRASWFAALLRARQLLLENACDVVFVVASDSRCDSASIAALTHANELLNEDNRDGLVPGEGACVALCCRPDSPLANLPSAICCEAVAIGREPHPFAGPQPNLSEGLTRVFRSLIPVASSVDTVIDCQTGQTRFTKEFHAAYLRCGPLMPEPLLRSSTAATFGEAGSATAGLAMVVAQLELSTRTRALVYASDDCGRLGAAILSRRGGRTALSEQLERQWMQGSKVPTSVFHSRAELLDDHLETCGYLQLDRLDDLDSAQIPWFDLHTIESRIQAQLDALALGGPSAIARARIGLESTSADRRQGSALVAGAWFAVGELANEVAELAERLDDVELDELAGALTLATHAGPTISALTHHSSPRLRRVGLELAATHPDVPIDALVTCLSDALVDVRSAAAISLARRNGRDQFGQLLAAADADPECVGFPVALVWLGHGRAVDRLRWLLWQRPELAVPSAQWLAMCGTPDDQYAIHQRLTSLEASPAIADVLGILGLPASIPHLLDILSHDEEQLRTAAARALERITGAGLHERIVDEHGVVEVRLSLDPERWRAWLDQRDGWPSGRLRGGVAWSLRSVWNELCSGFTPRHQRQLAADELSLRGPVRVAIEVRGPTARLRQVLAGWAKSLNLPLSLRA